MAQAGLPAPCGTPARCRPAGHPGCPGPGIRKPERVLDDVPPQPGRHAARILATAYQDIAKTLMDDTTNTFNRLRPRLQKIAYRMLGAVAEAEDVVQDAWLRW